MDGVDGGFDFRDWDITSEKIKTKIIQALEEWGNGIVDSLK
jgi:hypothetical protein